MFLSSAGRSLQFKSPINIISFFSFFKAFSEVSNSTRASDSYFGGLYQATIKKGVLHFGFTSVHIASRFPVGKSTPCSKFNARGGGHSYIMDDIDVCQGLSNPYPLQTKILTKFWTFKANGGKCLTLKRRKINF